MEVLLVSEDIFGINEDKFPIAFLQTVDKIVVLVVDDLNVQLEIVESKLVDEPFK